jgi:hypothetical protein
MMCQDSATVVAIRVSVPEPQNKYLSERIASR